MEFLETTGLLNGEARAAPALGNKSPHFVVVAGPSRPLKGVSPWDGGRDGVTQKNPWCYGIFNDLHIPSGNWTQLVNMAIYSWFSMWEMSQTWCLKMDEYLAGGFKPSEKN